MQQIRQVDTTLSAARQAGQKLVDDGTQMLTSLLLIQASLQHIHTHTDNIQEAVLAYQSFRAETLSWAFLQRHIVEVYRVVQ